MHLRHQKYIILFFIGSLNLGLIYTFILFNKVWYAYLCILALASLLNASSSLLNLGHKMLHPAANTYRLTPKNYIYVIPCYNESEAELRGSLHSLIEQRIVKGDKRAIVIICDGKVQGSGNTASTDQLLLQLLDFEERAGATHEYLTWDGTANRIYSYTGAYTYHGETVPLLLLIKEKNVGKRDSLVLIRRACYLYNTATGESPINDIFFLHLSAALAMLYNGKIDYIIGIDADTIFDYNCSYELIQGIERDENIHGCVGFVDICPQMNFASPFVMYQYAEYMFAQCLRRQAQSNITQKVSCLSGCNQILRISAETCGETILKVFNYLPLEQDDIFKHIRSYASEDRNHVCNMLSLYPAVKTTQTLTAISYTVVPTSVSVFLSQRRRWNLGANTNDMLLIVLPGINIFERILAGVNVFTFTCTPFVAVATVHFIISIFSEPTLLMLYLSILLFIPFFYSFLIPLFIKPLGFKDALYYYLSYLFFVAFSGIVGLTSFSYALLKMDVIKWGKTRLIAPAAAPGIEINKPLSLSYKPEWNNQFSVDIIV
jgi:chitin synthase